MPDATKSGEQQPEEIANATGTPFPDHWVVADGLPDVESTAGHRLLCSQEGTMRVPLLHKDTRPRPTAAPRRGSQGPRQGSQSGTLRLISDAVAFVADEAESAPGALAGMARSI
ncbi:hypothetical protein ACFQ7B_20240 [Streptomyces erythrochromogenes]|uniref:hypothetical protein n=1 Tax=Streptomyces erythrochromogenes TaxID=285574 RepID=UPI00367F696F